MNNMSDQPQFLYFVSFTYFMASESLPVGHANQGHGATTIARTERIETSAHIDGIREFLILLMREGNPAVTNVVPLSIQPLPL